MKCTHCGHEITGNAQFCGICGQKVEQPQQPAYNPAQPQQWRQPTAQGYQGNVQQSGKKKPKKKKGKAIIAIVLAVILIIGGTTGAVLAAKIMNNPMKKVYSGVSGMTSSNKAYKLTVKGTGDFDGDIYDLSGSAVIKSDRNSKTITVSDLTGGLSAEGDSVGFRNLRGLYDVTKNDLCAGLEYYESGESVEMYISNGTIAYYSGGDSETESGFGGLNYMMNSVAQALLSESEGQSTFDSLKAYYDTVLYAVLEEEYGVKADLDEESFNACQKKFVKCVADKKWLEENLGYRKDGDEYCFSISKKSLNAVLDIYDEFIRKSGLTDVVEDLVYELEGDFFENLKKLEISFKTGKNMLESLGVNLIMEQYGDQMKINGTITFEEASDPVVDTDAIAQKVKDAEAANSYDSYDSYYDSYYEPYYDNFN